MKNNILIIKHSSLGDWINATGVFKFIKQKFHNANIILITTQPYVQLAYSSGYFDEVWIHSKRVYLDIMRRKYTHVFDLQSSFRSKMYKFFIRCTGNNYALDRSNKTMHDIKKFYELLKELGMRKLPMPDIKWLNTDISHLNIPKKFALIIPGCTKKHAVKRWTPGGYAALISWLHSIKVQSVIIGSQEDSHIVDDIMAFCGNKPINLINKVGFHGISELARKSVFIIGGDTGPMHIAACHGVKTFLLCSNAARRSPARIKPLWNNVVLLPHDNLSKLDAEDVIRVIKQNT